MRIFGFPAAVIAVVACAALAGCGGSGGADRPDQDASLLLDFTPNGVHAGIYSAVRRGYDEAEGVHLHVRTPGPGTDAAKLLLTGRVTFAVLDLHDLAIARAKGRDLVGVLALVQRPLA
ncbi:MAG TPA: ABC transporter substrate-binding protein, partial [Solirubrobacteraceae bacterium]